MLKATDNELLTRTGGDTVMGRFFRRFWVPAFLSSELPDPGSPPVRTMIMGERLVAFRDYSGRIGVLQEFCAHRRASLYFGRNEGLDSRDGQCGLRCCYHGWKYDTSGQCIDMPNEPPGSRFRKHIRLTSYPVAERGDVVWIYPGPEDDAPPPPELEWTLVPEGHRHVTKRLQQCNFMQAMEGGIDTSHVSFLHSDAPLWHPEWTHSNRTDRRHLKAGVPKYFIEPTEYGALLGARRDAGEGSYYWRITQWLLPWYTIVPRDSDEPIAAHAWVPVDDEHCWTWNISYLPERPFRKRELDFYRGGGHIHAELRPGTFEPVRNQDNEYLVDRMLQKTAAFSGIAGIAMQDAAMQESMGPIVDRSQEHLGSSDAAIIAVRKRLLSEARACAEADVPAARPAASAYCVRSASAVLPDDTSWVTATERSRDVRASYAGSGAGGQA